MSAGSDYGRILASRRAPALPVARLRADLLEDRLEEHERRQDVLAGERPCAGGATRDERLLDRPVLLRILDVETVERMVARRPDGRARKRAARALRELLDERQVGDAVDDVVEPVVRAHPVTHDRTALLPRLA